MNLKTIKSPSRKQLFILRLMIVIGLVCTVFFVYSLFRESVVGYKPLYWLLISTFIYTFFKIGYEWYHYWSISVPDTPPLTKRYTVDIFTTFCAGEPYEMIVETLTAIQAITYPHKTYLCDEANDPYLKSVCEKLGVNHVTRTNKINAKAGNINNALRHSDGELCVVLDPDHIPVPEFLDPVVSHFDDPEIGYVQVVQAYYNQHTGWIAKGAAQQTYQFYGPMMMCMNSYGTVQAIGANCTFRRTALESIDGHAAGLAEDMHTAMQLHAKGWKSLYVPEVVTRGLVPATLSAYYKQQLKWSRGVFELLVTSYIKLFTRFNWRQKLHYGLLPMFYLSGFVYLINFLIPVIALFADVFPLRMDFSEFLTVSIPFITAVIVIRHYVQQWVMEDNERGFHVVGGLLLIGTWWVFILGFFYTLIRKDVPYIPTPKDLKDEKILKYNMPNIIVLLISIIAIIYGLYNEWNPFTFFMAGFVSLNCLFMIFMLVASSELMFQEYLKQRPLLYGVYAYIKNIKGHFWLLRRKVYSGMRAVSLMLVVFTVCVSLYGSAYTGDVSFSSANPLNWDIFSSSGKKPLVSAAYSGTVPPSQLIKYKNFKRVIHKPDAAGKLKPLLKRPTYFLSTRGVTYSKGHYWYKNIYPLTKKTIRHDFAEMKDAGVNTVKIYGPNVYDHLTLEVAEEQDLKINYSFWIPSPASFIKDIDKLDDLEKTILKTVNKNRDNPGIVAWTFGNSTLQQLDQYYTAPKLYYARHNYVEWLKQLIKKVKQADKTRPITMDIAASPTLTQTVNLVHEQIPEIEAFGLVINDKHSMQYITGLKNPYFFSTANPRAFAGTKYPGGGVFYANWQDQKTGWAVTFDGLKDIWGRNKPFLHDISKSWYGNIPANDLPQIKILRPAITTTVGAALKYNALVYVHDKWNLAAYMETGLDFEWHLVKSDSNGYTNDIQLLGKGPVVSVPIPDNIDTYRIYLVARKGENVIDASSTLNTPLN